MLTPRAHTHTHHHTYIMLYEFISNKYVNISFELDHMNSFSIQSVFIIVHDYHMETTSMVNNY